VGTHEPFQQLVESGLAVVDLNAIAAALARTIDAAADQQPQENLEPPSMTGGRNQERWAVDHAARAA